MEQIYKNMCAAVCALSGLLFPIRGLIICACIFIAIDFITGVAASAIKSRRAGRRFAFESGKAWNTASKLLLVMAGISLAWLIDAVILNFMQLHLAKLFTGFVCGVEFWSYLENAAEISRHPLFLHLRRYMKSKMDDALESDGNAGYDNTATADQTTTDYE